MVEVSCRTGRSKTAYYGTGTLIRNDGMILTTSTVVPPEAFDIKVRWADGREEQGSIQRTDNRLEIVVIKITRNSTDALPRLPFIPPGQSQSVTAGDPAYTAGNPHQTITRDGEVFLSKGIVSGHYTTQSADASSRYQGFVLETDAAVNHGCDGGPLMDKNGRLIGILSLCFTKGHFQGTAIPLNLISTRWPDLFNQEKSNPPTPSHTEHKETPLATRVAKVLQSASQKAARAVVRIHFEGEPSQAGPLEELSVPENGMDKDKFKALRPPTACGVLVEPYGTVLTSALNLANRPPPVRVELSDGRFFPVIRKGYHEDRDIAVLELVNTQYAQLPSLSIPQRADLKPGQFVCVLGLPPEKNRITPSFITRSAGIVSALDRFDGMAHQIDARIHFGNSGGPVIDLKGRLVGLSTQAGPRKLWARNSGVGFMASAAMIHQVLPPLLNGKVHLRAAQAFLGVRPAIGEVTQLGVKLSEVLPSAAAWEAGLRKDDVITAIDATVTKSWPGLIAALKGRKPGEQVRVSFLRGRRVFRANVVLDKRGEK